MIAFPNTALTQRVLKSYWVFAPLTALYCVLIVPVLFTSIGDFANPSLSVIQDLLGSENGTVVAWLHILVWDLFVGRWIYLHAQKSQINAWFVAVPLFFTLMSGPLGLTLYGLVYILTRKQSK